MEFIRIVLCDAITVTFPEHTQLECVQTHVGVCTHCPGESGKTLTIENGATLTVPADGALTLDGGTLTVNQEGTIDNSGTMTIESGTVTGTVSGPDVDPLNYGTITGSGTFKTKALTEYMIGMSDKEPILRYNGQDRSSDIVSNVGIYILGQKFALEGWDEPEVKAVTGDALQNFPANSMYDVTYTSQSDPNKTVTRPVMLATSDTDLTATLDKADGNYAYNDTITVTATVSPNGKNPYAAALMAGFAEQSSGDGTLALYEGGTQLCEPVKAEPNTEYTLTVAAKGLGVGSHTLTVKYSGKTSWSRRI